MHLSMDDDDAVMRVPGIVEKEHSPTVAVVVTPPSDERWAGFGCAATGRLFVLLLTGSLRHQTSSVK